jgi:hypothetical protein
MGVDGSRRAQSRPNGRRNSDIVSQEDDYIDRNLFHDWPEIDHCRQIYPYDDAAVLIPDGAHR